MLAVALLLPLCASAVAGAGGRAVGRRLEADDYALINAMMRDVTIMIPPIETAVPIGPFSADLTVWDLNCSRFAVGEIELESAVRPDGRVVTLVGALREFQIACYGRWSLQMLYYEEGTINLSTQTASIGVSYEVPAFRTAQNQQTAWLEQGPPLRMDECDASLPLEIDRAQGGIIASAISNDNIENLLIGMVQGDINNALCEALNGDLADALSGVLTSSKEFLEPYVARSFDMEAHRTSENVETEAKVEALAAVQNISLVSLAHNGSTKEAVGILSLLPATSRAARSVKALVAEGRSKQGDRIFAIQPLLQALAQVINMVADTIAGVGEVTIGASAIGSDGVFVLGSNNETQIVMHFMKVTLGGLNTFEVTQPTTVVGDYTLRHGFAVDDLSLRLDMALGVVPPGGEASLSAIESGAYEMEEFSVSAGLSELELELDAILALAENRITSLQLGTVAVAPIGCLLTTIFGVMISHLALHVRDMRFPVVQGFINDHISDVLTTLSQSIEAIFEPALLGALPSLVESLTLEPANAAIAGFLADVPNLLPNACPAVPPVLPTGDKYINFKSNSTGAEQLLSRALDMANDMLRDDDSGLSPVNEMVAEVVPSPTQVAQIRNVSVELPSKFYALAHTIDIVALNVSITNVNTIHGVYIGPAPDAEHVLRATGAVGTPVAPLTLELYINVRMWRPASASETTHQGASRRLEEIDEGRLPRGDTYTTEEFRIQVGASDIRILLDLLLLINQQRLAAMYASDALFYECWLATIAPGGLRIEQLLLTLGALDIFEVDCVNCDSSFFQTIAANAAAPGARMSMHQAIQDGLDAVDGLATNSKLTALIDQALADAPEQCETRSMGGYVEGFGLKPAPYCKTAPTIQLGELISESAAKVPWWQWLIVALVFGLLFALYIYWFYTRYRRVARAAQSLSTVDHLRRKQYLARKTSLFGSKAVPVVAKICIPLALGGNALLFLTGHLAVGATVDVVLKAGDETYGMPAYFTFSIAQSVIDMYNSGAVFLAFVVAIFSGLWPYFKLASMLYLWFAPSYIVRPDNRGSIFAWLDTLGKWSMIDVFVMILSVVGFNVTLRPPAAFDFLWKNLFSVQLLVTPRWGLYANLLAQLVSQLSSHACLFYHRAHLSRLDELRKLIEQRDNVPCIVMKEIGGKDAEQTDDYRLRGFLSPRWSSASNGKKGVETDGAVTYKVPEEEPQPLQPLNAHVYSVGNSSRHFVMLKWRFTSFLVLSLLLLVPLIIAASTLPNVGIAYNGIVGVLMEAHKEGSHTRSFSIIGLGKFIAMQAVEQWQPTTEVFLETLGMYLVVIILFLCTIAAPVLQCFALALLYFKRMSHAAQVYVYIAVEVISAWSYQEVYIIACVLGISQIETISRFLVGCHCNDLVPFFAALQETGVLEKEFAECFYSAANFEVAIYLLLSSGLYLSLITQIMMRTARVAFGQKRLRRDGVRPARPWLQYWMIPGYVVLRRLCTHRLELVDESSPAPTREAVALAMGDGSGVCALPAYEVGPWRLLWQADARRVWYFHSKTGELRDTRLMGADAALGSTIAIGICNKADGAPVPPLVLEAGDVDEKTASPDLRTHHAQQRSTRASSAALAPATTDDVPSRLSHASLC